LELFAAKFFKLIASQKETYFLTERASYLYHYWEQQYTIVYIDKTRNILRKITFSPKIVIGIAQTISREVKKLYVNIWKILLGNYLHKIKNPLSLDLVVLVQKNLNLRSSTIDKNIMQSTFCKFFQPIFSEKFLGVICNL
jgi:hypothetical protein